MKKLLAIVALMALGGCMTADDVRNRPADFTAVYNVPWETMANCIQDRFIDAGVVTPQFNQRNRTAVLTVAVKTISGGSGPVVAEYRVRQIDGDRSEVEFRERPSLFGSPAFGRGVADRCGRSA